MDFFSDIIILQYHYFYLLIALLLFSCIYMLAKRIIVWGMDRGLGFLLSYVFGGLLFLNLFYLVMIIRNQNVIAEEMLRYLLQIIGLYGFLLIIAHGIKFIFKKFLGRREPGT